MKFAVPAHARTSQASSKPQWKGLRAFSTFLLDSWIAGIVAMPQICLQNLICSWCGDATMQHLGVDPGSPTDPPRPDWRFASRERSEGLREPTEQRKQHLRSIQEALEILWRVLWVYSRRLFSVLGYLPAPRRRQVVNKRNAFDVQLDGSWASVKPFFFHNGSD